MTLARHKLILAVLGIILVAFVVGVFANRQPNPPEPNLVITPATPSTTPADMSNATRSIKQGTQLHLSEDVDVAVGGIFDNKAWLYLHKRDVGSEKRDVVVGDKFEIYGYMIEVKGIGANTSLSLAPGSGNGYVKLLISKK